MTVTSPRAKPPTGKLSPAAVAVAERLVAKIREARRAVSDLADEFGIALRTVPHHDEAAIVAAANAVAECAGSLDRVREDLAKRVREAAEKLAKGAA